MRKLFVLLLVTALACLCGCDDRQEEINALEARLGEYAQYDALIGHIENDEYEKAQGLLDAYEMQYHNEQVTAGNLIPVEIGIENASEYFEVVELTEWCRDDMGETTGFITHVCIALREEYFDKVIAEESLVDFAWQALCSVKNCSVDTVNCIVSIENIFSSGATTFGEPETLNGTFSFDGRYLAEECLTGQYVVGKIGEIVVIGEYSLDGEMKPVCFDYENVSITQAQGLLMLRS